MWAGLIDTVVFAFCLRADGLAKDEMNLSVGPERTTGPKRISANFSLEQVMSKLGKLEAKSAELNLASETAFAQETKSRSSASACDSTAASSSKAKVKEGFTPFNVDRPPPDIEWSVCRDAKTGEVDEAAERRRCEALLALADRSPIMTKNGPRDRDLKFSWEALTHHNSEENLRMEIKLAGLRNSKVHKLIVTPLDHDMWERELHFYPDRLLVALVLDGIRNGVNIAYRGERMELKDNDNRPSAQQQAAFLDEQISAEQSKGRTSPWFSQAPFTNMRIAPVGVIPKRENGKQVGWRLIYDASYPLGGNSVNAFINKIQCACAGFERALELLALAGPNAWLLKWDVKSAFRLLAVRVVDQHLLGMKVSGKYCWDIRPEILSCNLGEICQHD